ncbi:hypothetical protein VIGAN_08355600 [Vigna angularis var. angularis]|uniref:Uncharacterized protein n=1 Tax=Vigna angularis var. angularis TaxID=157739 RepID=A0A0S3SUR6_PHAAN|nr:hypothetical protein VIGAN_08355600 [Vigna angularis var. angularis]
MLSNISSWISHGILLFAIRYRSGKLNRVHRYRCDDLFVMLTSAPLGLYSYLFPRTPVRTAIGLIWERDELLDYQFS